MNNFEKWKSNFTLEDLTNLMGNYQHCEHCPVAIESGIDGFDMEYCVSTYYANTCENAVLCWGNSEADND